MPGAMRIGSMASGHGCFAPNQVITGNPICDAASDTNSLLRPGSSPVPSWPSSGTAFTFCDQLAFDVYY